MMICSTSWRLLIGLWVVVGLAMVTPVPAWAAPGDPQPAGQTLGVSPIAPLPQPLILGGPSHRMGMVALDDAMLKRLVLKPADLLEASVELKVQQTGPRATVLAQGQAGDGQQVRIDEQVGLDAIKLDAGDRLMILAWRSEWHWWGAGTLVNLTLTPGKGQALKLPEFKEKPEVAVDGGTWSLGGITKRDNLPEIKQWAAAKDQPDAGKWNIEGGKGVSITSKADGLRLQSNGRSDWSKDYDWAPALVFQANAAGTYKLQGTLKIDSGKSSDETKANSVSWMVLTMPSSDAKVAKEATLSLHRLLRPWTPGDEAPGAKLVAGRDYETQAVASAPVPDAKVSKAQPVALEGLAASIRQSLGAGDANHGYLVTVQSKGDLPPPWVVVGRGVEGRMTLTPQPTHRLYEPSVVPTEGVYVRREGSRLMYGDKRLRLWGVASGVRSPDAIERLSRMGFNAVRLWPKGGQQGVNPYYETDPATMTKLLPSERLDQYDRSVAVAKKAGVFIMSPFLGNPLGLEQLTLDNSIVAGGEDWEEWKVAVKAAKGSEIRIAAIFDQRLAKGYHQHAINILNHVNPHTGKRYADEETIAIWELGNERWILDRALGSNFDKWTPYFRDKLQHRWNQWLTERHGDTERLKTAWGKLGDDESLTNGSVILAPVYAKRDDYPQARGDDMVRFMIELTANFYKELEAVSRAQGKPGVGVAVVPFSYDTQFRPHTPWHYSTDAFSDVSNFGMYYFTLSSALTSPPGMYVMDSHTIAGKPTVIYETNASRPSPYRVEQAYRTAALASWQDWDAVFWHYYHLRDWSDVAYLAQDVPYMSESFYWSAVEIQTDPAMLSAIGLAGQMFLHETIDPATDPVIYRVGKKDIFGYERWNGLSTSRAAFQQGAALKYEPESDFDIELQGAKPEDFEGRINGAVHSGKQITWDWINGRLIIDSPTAHAYVGKTPPDGGWYRFSDGMAVGAFDTDFVAFAVVSADGKPLVGPNATGKVYLNARYDAANTGFAIDAEKITKPNGGFVNPVTQAKAIKSNGRAPVIEQAVGFTLAWPTQLDATLVGYDFATREVARVGVMDARLTYHGPALFSAVLEIHQRGQPASTPQTTLAVTEQTDATAADGAQTTDGATNGSPLWHPVAALDWSQSPQATLDAIEKSKLPYTSKTFAKKDNVTQLSLTGVKVLFDTASDMVIRFEGESMRGVAMSFAQPPTLAVAIDALSKQLGKPASSRINNEAFEESRVVWQEKKEGQQMTVTLVQTQGNLSLEFVRGDQ